jgi:hypothetical protein
VLAFARVLGNCPRCRYDDVRRSRRPRGVLLGLRRHRCMACGAIVLVPETRRGEAMPRSAHDGPAPDSPP